MRTLVVFGLLLYVSAVAAQPTPDEHDESSLGAKWMEQVRGSTAETARALREQLERANESPRERAARVTGDALYAYTDEQGRPAYANRIDDVPEALRPSMHRLDAQ